MSLKGFADWLAATPPSVLIQKNEVWAIPTIQSVHIAGIGVVLACVLMVALRMFGVIGLDRTVAQTQQRFGPWLVGALWLLLATGVLMVIGEPERELITFSFWAKMSLVVVLAGLAWAFARSVREGSLDWDALAAKGSTRALMILIVIVCVAIVFLGRLIAYDHVWGPLSPATKA